MIIIKSQDGKMIVKCDKVEYWPTDENAFEVATNYKYYVDGMSVVDETFDSLGIYESEEQVKEIMNNIYTYIHMKYNGVYTMPTN